MNEKERIAVALFDNSNVKGVVLFKQTPNSPVHVSFNFRGLKPDTISAIHIHEYGDEREGCTSLGGHWNPHKQTHGSIILPELGRHAGDLINNIKSDEEGNFVYEYYDDLLNLFGSIETTIIGRSVVIHEGVDDLGLGGLNNDGTIDWKRFETSLENGNAGSRMACAIIGIASNN